AVRGESMLLEGRVLTVSGPGPWVVAMPMRLPPLLRSGHLIHHRGAEIGLLVFLAFVLELAAGTGLAYIAGFASIQQVLPHFWADWTWLAGVAGSLAVSFYGYYLAYDGVFRSEAGPSLPGPRMRAIVAAGFGGFLSHGGPALDAYALRAAGASKRDAAVRVTGLAGLEHGVLSLGAAAAAIVVLATARGAPPADFTLPWAVVPVPGFLLAFWLAERYRARLRDRPGLRGRAGLFLDSIHLVRTLFLAPGEHWPAVPGMALYWAADMFAAWLGLAAFGYRMNAAAFIVAMATGMVFTRRTGPLAGAGVLALVLPLTLWYSGAPLAVATVGIFAYRILTLALPLPFALAALPGLRAMGRRRDTQAPGIAEQPSDEPALRGDDGRQ
ncbi:MAG TPA: hypothetical protein VGI74_26205, partial [Streptosporangiaceae bacterium]